MLQLVRDMPATYWALLALIIVPMLVLIFRPRQETFYKELSESELAGDEGRKKPKDSAGSTEAARD
jgi:hypothetical protein